MGIPAPTDTSTSWLLLLWLREYHARDDRRIVWAKIPEILWTLSPRILLHNQNLKKYQYQQRFQHGRGTLLQGPMPRKRATWNYWFLGEGELASIGDELPLLMAFLGAIYTQATEIESAGYLYAIVHTHLYVHI